MQYALYETQELINQEELQSYGTSTLQGKIYSLKHSLRNMWRINRKDKNLK